MKENELIAQRIKELRNAHELTLEQFGNIVGVYKSTVFRWENGRVETLKANIVQQLSKHFRVNPLWLLGYDVPKEIETDRHKELTDRIVEEMVWLNERQLEKILNFINEYIK